MVALATREIRAGSKIHFKFTCSHCGAKNMFEEINKLFTEGSCGECSKITDIEQVGAGFLIVADLKPRAMSSDQLDVLREMANYVHRDKYGIKAGHNGMTTRDCRSEECRQNMSIIYKEESNGG